MNTIRIAIALSVLMLVSVTVQAQDRPPALVETEEVSSQKFNDQLRLVGRTEAAIESRIVSEIDGQVEEVSASEGTRVKKGSPLVIIDSELVELTLKAKRAEAEQARHQAHLAESDLKRVEELYGKNLVSENAQDSAQTWAMINRERFNQLEAETNKLERDVRNCTIRAPFDGYVGRKLVDVGEWVSRGTPVYEMADLSEVKVTVDLPERYFGRLKTGSPAIIKTAQNGNQELSGVVTGISPNASQETHTFPVIVTVPNSERKLGGGMLVSTILSLDNKFESLAVSKDAIIRQGDKTLVYTVQDGKAVPIYVSLNSSQGKMVAVSGSGLSAGMQVVVKGNERIFPGSPVRTSGDMRSSRDDSSNPIKSN